MTHGLVKIATIPCALMLVGCGEPSPFIFAEPPADDSSVDGTAPEDDPNNAFLFDAARNLTANSFVYDPVNDTIIINNLPFDNSDTTGTSYVNAGDLEGTDIPFFRSTGVPGSSFTYFAVILQSESGFSFGGSVATGNFGDFGFGGAFIQRTEQGLPPAQPQSYIYTGDYAGTRVVGNGGQGDGDVGLVLGSAELEVDILDLDTGGNAIGGISGRTLYDSNGNELGSLANLQLNLGTIDQETGSISGGTTDVRNSDATVAQDGDWFGLFSGPNGEEIAGYVVVEGTWSDDDFGFTDEEGVVPATIRETGVFILDR